MSAIFVLCLQDTYFYSQETKIIISASYLIVFKKNTAIGNTIFEDLHRAPKLQISYTTS